MKKGREKGKKEEKRKENDRKKSPKTGKNFRRGGGIFLAGQNIYPLVLRGAISLQRTNCRVVSYLQRSLNYRMIHDIKQKFFMIFQDFVV